MTGALRYVLSEGHVEDKEEAVTYALMRAAGEIRRRRPTRQLGDGEESRADDPRRAEFRV